jgi:hypothetical protein
VSDEKDVEVQRKATESAASAAQRIAERNARNQARFDKAARIIVQVLINDAEAWFTLGEIMGLIGTWTEPIPIGRYEASCVLHALATQGNKLVHVRTTHGRREYQIDPNKARRRYDIVESQLVRPTPPKKGSKAK